MAETNSILGRRQLDLGPSNVYVKPLFISSVETDWADNSDWIDLGFVESLTQRFINTKTDLNASQEGTRPADKVITGQQAQIETNLGQPFLERLELIQQGLTLIKDSAGLITQWQFGKRLGERDSDTFFWVRAIKIERGIESVDLLDRSFMKAAAMSDTVELVFDAATQRFYGVLFESYLNDTGAFSVVDTEGRFAYNWSGDTAA